MHRFILIELAGLAILTVFSTFPALAADSGIIDEAPTTNYLQLNETDPIPKNILNWEADSAKTLFFSKTELPFVYLKGKLKAGYGLAINDRFITPTKGRFTLKLSLPLAISTFTLKIFDPGRNFETYRLLGFWTRVPPSFRVKVEENGKVVEKSLGFSGRVKRAAFTQLYSDDAPVSLVDLDSQKHAKLSFRVYYPPEPEQLYDAWSIVIKNSRGNVVAEMRRFGSPPTFIDWREVADTVLRRDTYFYQVNLYKESSEFAGIPNRFETIEGLSLMRSHYSQSFEIEPRAEIGYFSLAHTQPPAPTEYTGVFVSADVGFSFWNRFLLRGSALSALERVDPNEKLTITRLGTGMRFYAHGENAWLGSPHLVRLDVLAILSAIGIAPNAYVPRFIDYGILVEPHIVLWAYNYLVPFVEYGIRPERGLKRLSYGLSYYFFVRPWSMRLGLGFGVDKILNYQHPLAPEPEEDRKFSTLKTYATIIFYL